MGQLFESENNFKNAEIYYLKAYNAAKNNDDINLFKTTCFNLGNLYEKNNKMKEALYYFDQAALNGDAVSAYRAALIYETSGDIQKAEDYYLKAIKLGFLPAYMKLGELLEREKRYQHAITVFLRVAELDFDCDERTNAQFKLGQIYEKLKDYASALTWYIRAARNGHSKDWDEVMKLGELLEREEQYQGAINAFSSVAVLDFPCEERTLAQYKLGQIYEKLKDYDSALVWYRDAARNGHSKAGDEISRLTTFWKKASAAVASWYRS